jgi:hypothetical protein
MTLTELVENLSKPDKIEKFIQSITPEIPTEALLIYMEGELDLNSKLSFLGIEETDDDLIYENNGVRYVQLFPVEMAIELIQMFKPTCNFEIAKICKRLLAYRVNDA